MTTHEKALLPCPYCGERNELYPAYRLDKDGKCIEPPYAIDCLGCGHDFTPREGIDARKAWNRRAPSAPLSGDAGELVGRLESRAKSLNGSLVGASDGSTYTLGYYDQFAAKDDREAVSLITALVASNAEKDAALEPFAIASKHYDDCAAHFGHELPPDLGEPRTFFTHAQLRAARRARSAKEAE